MSDTSDQTALIDFYDVELNILDLLSKERYQDRKLLSRGGVKEVYSVRDMHCARDVAFASIKDEVFNMSQAVDFIREIQITSGFEHPNIIRVYDVGIEDDRPWFTMELSSEKTLADFIKSRTVLSLPDRLEIFVQLCDAVHYAHERDVLHLDLKPDNIAIGQQGQVLLADWGIASSMGDRPGADLVKAQSRYEYIKGSLGYMAPEQLTSGYQKARTVDVFALGGILFFLLTKESPILGDGQNEVEENTQEGLLKSFTREDIPERLAPLLAKVLAKDPQDRYQSVIDLKADIVAFRNGFATSAESASGRQQFVLFCRRNKALAATVMVTTGILLGFTGYYIFSIKESESRARMAQSASEFEKQEADEERKKAQVALDKYTESNRLRVLGDKEFAEALFDAALGEMSLFDFDQALVHSQRSVEKDPESEEANRRLAMVYFIRQDFGKAAFYFKKSDLHAISVKKAVERFENSSIPLSESDLEKVLNLIYKDSFVSICVLKYDATVRTPEEHSQIVAHFLKLVKRGASESFKYNAKSQTVDLSASLMAKDLYIKTKYTNRINLVSTLPIKVLILKDTAYNRKHAELRFRPNPTCEILFK